MLVFMLMLLVALTFDDVEQVFLDCRCVTATHLTRVSLFVCCY